MHVLRSVISHEKEDVPRTSGAGAFLIKESTGMFPLPRDPLSVLPSTEPKLMPRLSQTDATSRRGVAVLGSTGSIGRQTLEVIRRHSDLFSIEVLTCGSNAELLIEQAVAFGPRLVVLGSVDHVDAVRSALSGLDIEVAWGPEAIAKAVEVEGVETVVAAMVGFAGLAPVVRAAELGITIALANKEALVVAGQLVCDIADRTGAQIIPVDSEHSAIHQCLEGESPEAIERLILTASGGPFRDRPAETFDAITREEALAHPNWSMGQKITIDSATMMNKGLELIEAHWLFGLDADRIDIVVHPQSIVHSMIEFVDGSVKAQLSEPDMRLPIQYALGYPRRLTGSLGKIDWTQDLRLDFEAPDPEKFPCIRLAYEVAEAGGTAPAVLNAANEVAVQLFLEGRISFTTIPLLIEDALTGIGAGSYDSLASLYEVDAETRQYVAELKRAPAN
jgi:1-deoxy-D-xylulose-5-phosphate reductoisomerase